MISISTLYCGRALPSHELRYGTRARRRGPVVVFNCTDRCNLSCAHCYSSSSADAADADDLTTAEAAALLDDLAALRAPVVLFSGGEPLLREDLPELIARAAGAGIRPVVSTNGTLITAALAARLAEAGTAYVGVSIDGLRAAHDAFRGRAGAFDDALAGIARCQDAGIKVGLRMTLTRRNVADLEGVFELVRRRGIPRICFYHLVYAGRGSGLRAADLSHERRREVLDRIMDFAADLHPDRPDAEVLTVDNHADGPFVVLRLRREDPPRAERALALLRAGGGNASGVRLAAVTHTGAVLPDQFSAGWVLGNVRRRRFGEIWHDGSNELLARLRARPRAVAGRCRTCRWLHVCNGNFRARAEAATGDRWACDPQCYLTDDEIAPEDPDNAGET